MRKWICFSLGFLCLFLLVGCQSFDISKILFIASVGIEKKDDETYQGYFYLPLSSDIGKTETTENKGKGEFAKTSGKNIPELFHNIQAATSLNINFRHVSSIVLNEELLTKEFIIELCDFIKYSLEIDFNCYMFATKEKLEELYDFENPNQESVLNSLLVSSSDASDLFLVAPPMHFLKFACDFYENKSILLPLLVLEEIWTIESEPVKNFHAQSAIYYFEGKVKEVDKNQSSPYFSQASSFIDQIKEGCPIHYTDYKIKLDYKNQLQVKVEFGYKIMSSENKADREEVQQFVYHRIQEYIEEFHELDPLNLKYMNHAYGTNCTYDTMNIEIIIHRN